MTQYNYVQNILLQNTDKFSFGLCSLDFVTLDFVCLDFDGEPFLNTFIFQVNSPQFDLVTYADYI